MKLIEQAPQIFNRREFLKGLGLTASYLATEALLFPVFVEKAQHTLHKHIPILVTGLAPYWDETVIVHMSDMHLAGRGIDFFDPDSALELSASITQSLKQMGADPDKTFIFDSGDVVSKGAGDGRESSMMATAEMAGYLQRIPAAGKFVTGGNHDLAHSQADQLWNIFSDAGYQVCGLPSQGGSSIGSGTLPFQVIATPDFTGHASWYRSAEGKQFLQQVQAQKTKPSIWLTHNASLFDRGILNPELLLEETLSLSGHTHGGQVGANTPLQLLAGRVALRRVHYDSEYIHGLYPVGNSGLVHVSAGLGHAHSHGVRTAQPEVVFFTLTQISVEKFGNFNFNIL